MLDCIRERERERGENKRNFQTFVSNRTILIVRSIFVISWRTLPVYFMRCIFLSPKRCETFHRER